MSILAIGLPHETAYVDADSSEHRNLLQTGRAIRCYIGHALMENRNGLVVDGGITQASGTAEREAALAMLDRRRRRRRIAG